MIKDIFYGITVFFCVALFFVERIVISVRQFFKGKDLNICLS
jgi:hypothetical protein